MADDTLHTSDAEDALMIDVAECLDMLAGEVVEGEAVAVGATAADL